MLVAIEANKGAIFRDVGHALHTAFLVISNEPRQGCVTRSMLLQMMATRQEDDSTLPPLTAEQAEWFAVLKGSPAGTIDFSGLTDDEIRAQCALIVAAVRHHLPAMEMNAMVARFGATEYKDVDGVRCFGFAKDKGEAVLALAAWLRPVVSNVPVMGLDLLLARHYSNHARTAISVRELGERFKCSHMKFQRAAKLVAKHLRELEQQAHARLYPYFVRQGIICEREDSCEEVRHG